MENTQWSDENKPFALQVLCDEFNIDLNKISAEDYLQVESEMLKINPTSPTASIEFAVQKLRELCHK